jgi:hypothetical protein
MEAPETYDFLLVPAGLAPDAESAVALWQAAPPGTAPDAGDALAVAVADLRRRGVTVTARRGAAYVVTSWEDPMARLSEVADVAGGLGLAVLDVQLGSLYDPRGAAPVALDTQGGPRLTFVTRRILTDVLREVAAGAYRWVTLSRSADVFVQAFRDGDGSWALEHSEGLGRHFATRTLDPTLVESVLWSWARGDQRWPAMVEFSPVQV